jgi:hypothetical protein
LQALRNASKAHANGVPGEEEDKEKEERIKIKRKDEEKE